MLGKFIRKQDKLLTIRYFWRTPLRFLAILGGGFRRAYFYRTLEEVSQEARCSYLRNLLPGRFLIDLSDRGLLDEIEDRLLLYYFIVRKFKPEIVVETGVARGWSSALILAGMEENGRGHLYSIDLPAGDSQVRNKQGEVITLVDGQKHHAGEQTGWVVPEFLRSRWALLLGDARDQLPRLLNDLGDISIFIHDSLHTYEHMMFEYLAAWPHVSQGGLLLSHDITDNCAFLDFCASSKRDISKVTHYYSTGIVVKA